MEVRLIVLTIMATVIPNPVKASRGQGRKADKKIETRSHLYL
jgi:hypothetical protein